MAQISRLGLNIMAVLGLVGAARACRGCGIFMRVFFERGAPVGELCCIFGIAHLGACLGP